MSERSEEKLIEEIANVFAKEVCKVKGWSEDEHFDVLVDAIKKGQWNTELNFWLNGRQSVLDKLTANIGNVFKF